jgi:serine/threonine-protein kinase
MDAERWKQISELAGLAAETAPEQRERILGARPDLRAEVESLLAQLDEGTGPLDRGVEAGIGDPAKRRRIGDFEVVGELGRGGMGVVLLARRSGQELEQTVAIKLAGAAFQSEFYERRFVEERQILASLEHANIARLLDGGVTEDGTPYLVMQYVDGEPLDRYADGRELGLEARLTLFAKVCAAVEYAHEHLVIHRDLKPGNILVTAAGEPILLDFGTARLMRPSETGTNDATSLPMLTVRYASPEQLNGLTGSTRSDVYSLGVVLYELLTGRWPYEGVTGGTAAQMRAILESEPLTASKASIGFVPGTRLRGDLDSILRKALEKAPEQRYGTVAELAADLKRFAANEPVQARRATWGYRAERFIRRHRWGVAAAAVVVASLTAATVVSVRQLQIAEREREKAEQVAMFVERLLGASRSGRVTPLATRGQALTVVEVIDDAAKTVGEEFRNQPAVEAGLRSTIASTYMALGQQAAARPHVEQAVTLTESVYGQKHLATARAWTARGRLRLAAGEYPGAVEDLRKSLAVQEALQSKDLDFLHSLLGEALWRSGDLNGAREQMERALAGMREKFGTNHIATATMLNNVAVMREDAGDFAGSEQYLREAAEILRGLPGPPANLAYPLFGLQRVHLFRGEYAEAKKICEEAHRVTLASGGARHPLTASALSMLSLVKAHLGEADAEAMARESVQQQRALFPAGHIEIARSLVALGRVLLLRGVKVKEAEAILREAHAMTRKIYPQKNWRPAEARMFLAASLRMQEQRGGEAAELAEAAWAEIRAVLPEGHPRVEEAARLRGCVLGKERTVMAACLLPR